MCFPFNRIVFGNLSTIKLDSDGRVSGENPDCTNGPDPYKIPNGAWKRAQLKKD